MTYIPKDEHEANVIDSLQRQMEHNRRESAGYRQRDRKQIESVLELTTPQRFGYRLARGLSLLRMSEWRDE